MQAQQLVKAVAVFRLDAGDTGAGLMLAEASAMSASVMTSASSEHKSYPQVERRGPHRAKNVSRLGNRKAAAAQTAPEAAKTGTDDD